MQLESIDDPRFGGIARLYGRAGLQRLRNSHVAVFGIGGVGSWAAEALARSGIGALTLVDLDDICMTNTNRQVHALSETFGMPKVEVMAVRVRSISPGCAVTALGTFFSPSTASQLFTPSYDAVIDAVDGVAAKRHLLLLCREKGAPIVVSGGAGGKRDPSAVRIADLSRATHDPLLRKLRRVLRSEDGFPGPGQDYGVSCVFSEEKQRFPHADGTVCSVPEPGSSLRLDCASGYGTAAFVTGAFGFACAAEVIRLVLTMSRELVSQLLIPGTSDEPSIQERSAIRSGSPSKVEAQAAALGQ